MHDQMSTQKITHKRKEPMSATAIVKRCAAVAEKGWIATLADEMEKPASEKEAAKSVDDGRKVIEVLMPAK